MTEASPLVACIRPKQNGPDGSVGPLVAGLKAKVLDPETGKGKNYNGYNSMASIPVLFDTVVC